MFGLGCPPAATPFRARYWCAPDANSSTSTRSSEFRSIPIKLPAPAQGSVISTCGQTCGEGRGRAGAVASLRTKKPRMVLLWGWRTIVVQLSLAEGLGRVRVDCHKMRVVDKHTVRIDCRVPPHRAVLHHRCDPTRAVIPQHIHIAQRLRHHPREPRQQRSRPRRPWSIPSPNHASSITP